MFLDKILFKNFKEQVQSFLNVTGDSLVQKTRLSSINITNSL